MTLPREENWAEGFKDLFVKGQFPNSCSNDLAAHLRENVLVDLDSVAAVAERFLTAHNRRFQDVNQPSSGPQSSVTDRSATAAPKAEQTVADSSGVQCFVYKRYGHRAFEVPTTREETMF